jgi:hypothetical protein
MRKALIILVVGLAVLLFPTPALSGTHTGNTSNHVHFVPTGATRGTTVEVVGRMWRGGSKKCLNAPSNGVKISSDRFTGEGELVGTDQHGFFRDTWTMGSTVGPAMVYVRCLSTNVLYKGHFSVKSVGAMPDTGTPALLTLGVGLALTTVGWLMLLAARSDRLRPAILIPRGARGRSVDRAGGLDTAATRRR